jgi:hypothetical protein
LLSEVLVFKGLAASGTVSRTSMGNPPYRIRNVWTRSRHLLDAAANLIELETQVVQQPGGP